MKRFRLPLFALIALLACACAQAEPVVVERFDPGNEVVAVDAILGGSHADDFVAQPYAAITPARTRALWYRLNLTQDWGESRPPLLGIDDPQGLVVTVYLPPDYQPLRRSLYERNKSEGFTLHALSIVLPQGLRANTPIYLKVEPERAIPRRVRITGIAEAHDVDLAHARLDTLFPSIQFASVLVILCFFFALREGTYGYFVGHMLFVVLYELYASGIGYELRPFDLLAPLGQRPIWIAVSLASLFHVQFSIRFLDMTRAAPRLARLMRASRWPLGAVAFCAAIPALSPGWWVGDAMRAILLLGAPLLMLAGLFAWQHGDRRGGFYLCAWVPGLVLVVVRVLQLSLQWPLPDWLEFMLPATFTLSSIVLSFGLADHTLAMRHERDVAHRLAERDALTGALNRRAILARLRAVFLRARESGEPLALLFLDLDHFKRVNDTHGHRAGDSCLRALIEPIATELRQGDALGRYGGEEFLVVLPGATAANAAVIAERIRARVQDMPILVSGMRIGVTVSIGIAALDAAMNSPDDLVERADAALYGSKAAGRNRVTTHPGPDAPGLGLTSP